MSTIPTLFVSHGSPMLALDTVKGADFHALAASLPRPKAILVVSAHWESRGPVVIGATAQCPLIYDFYGFPKPLYEVEYPAPGAPELAQRVEQLLSTGYEVTHQPQRGLDHGAWVPLALLFPDASVPVLQVSLPRDRTPKELWELGKALAPLREEGFLIVASGSMTHNLRDMDFTDTHPPVAWAREFDTWVAEALERHDLEALFDFHNRAPHALHAHPTDEHFTPLFVAMGAAETSESPPSVSFPISGFEYGNLARRCVEFG